MILLLAGLRSLPQQPFEAAALDGVPRFFVFWRITLPMLTALHPDGGAVPGDRKHPAVRHHLRDDPRRAGNTLTVFQVEAYLNFFQSTNVGRSAGADDDPLGDHLRAVERLHQELAAPARTGAGLRRALWITQVRWSAC
jgi:hypothetical protein